MSAAQTIPAAWKAHDERVLPYVRAHRVIGQLRLGLGLALLALAFRQHAFSELEQHLTGTFSGFSLYVAFFGLLGAAWTALSFPLSLAGYWIERRHGVSRQTAGAWLLDQVKGLAVGSALALIVLLFAWWAVAALGQAWWIAFAGFLFLFSVLLAQLAPVLLLPLFFKMKPLPEGALREQLIALSARFGVSVRDIYLLGLGDKTEKGNAAFMGIGRTKRIALGDTIYEKYPSEQVLAVFGHELGHLVHGDIWRGLALSTASLFLTFGLAQWITQAWLLPRWFTWIESPYGLFLYLLTVSVVGIPLGIVERLHSRWRERLADDFAAKKVQMAPELAGALEALTFQNRSLFVPELWREWLFYSHPAPWRRILTLRG